MTSITAADLKLGGRIVAACDAIGAGHLRRAAGIFNEVADDLNGEAEATTGLLSEEAEAPVPIAPKPAAITYGALDDQARQKSEPIDMTSCSRNVHSYGVTDPVSGWRTCSTCGQVNVAPPENQGAIDMSARR